MGIGFSMIMDVLVMLLLAGTIFYAIRLSFYIQAFRSSKSELETLVQTLSAQVEKAEQAIAGMRRTAQDSGRDLQAMIQEGQALCEELQIMNQTGNNIAGRLEKLAEQAAGQRHAQQPQPETYSRSRSRPQPARRSAVKEIDSLDHKPVHFSSFAIRDPEFGGADEDNIMDDEGLFSDEFEREEDELDEFSSRAEKELYKALYMKSDAEEIS